MNNTMKVYEYRPDCRQSGGNLLIAAESKKEADALMAKHSDAYYLAFVGRAVGLTAKMKNYGLPYIILDSIYIE